jgi:electron transport complex protein RnfG
MKTSKNPLVLISVLTIIALLSGVILGFANSVTEDVIIENEIKATNAALQAVMPNADTFDIVESGDEALVLYECKQNGTLVGVAGIISTNGFGGQVRIMVGVDVLTGAMTSARVLSHSETPGLGARVEEEAHLSQYNGKSGELALNKDGGNIDAISGATISSRAVLEGVNEATKIVKSYIEKGGAA